MKNIKKIYFFYPSNILGGAELLFKRTAEILSNNFEVIIIDIPNGWLANHIENSTIKITYLNHDKYRLDDDGTLLTTANLLFKLDNYFEKTNTKILLWVVQPYNIIPSLPKLKLTYKNNIDISTLINNIYLNITKQSRRNVIQKIIEKNGIVAMDNACNIIAKHFLQLEYKSYLPIFLDNKIDNNSNQVTKINKSNITAAWLGRLDSSFKLYILQKVMIDLNEYAKRENINIHFSIIGDGDAYSNLLALSKECTSLKITFLGTLKDQDLENTLRNQNIGFAMGTSALEMAMRSIPTILLDFSYVPLKNDYSYRWLFEAKNYDLGRDISYLTNIKCTNNIDNIFEQLSRLHASLQEKCSEHVNQFHSIEHVKLKLMNSLSATNLNMHDIYSYRKEKPFWIKLKQIIGKK